MVLRGATSDTRQLARHEPLFNIHPRTGTKIEVFYADPTLETFGSVGLAGSGSRAGTALPPNGSSLSRARVKFAGTCFATSDRIIDKRDVIKGTREVDRMPRARASGRSTPRRTTASAAASRRFPVPVSEGNA